MTRPLQLWLALLMGLCCGFIGGIWTGIWLIETFGNA